jgi:hypothetical protein
MNASLSLIPILVLAAGAANAVTPTLVHYQGRLLDTNGAPINGTPAMAVALHTNATAGAALFAQSLGAVPVQNGMFEFQFGTNTHGFAETLTNATCWLELLVDGSPLAPRQRLIAVPYAVHVLHAALTTNATEAGVGAAGAGGGTAFGVAATAQTRGTAAGDQSAGEFFGVAIGADTLGFNAGAAVGYGAYAYQYGVAVGVRSDGSLSNVAIGAYANASGDGTALRRTAVGYAVTNSIDNSTAVRGDLYLDGGRTIRTRSTFGSGAWTPYPGGWTGIVTNGTRYLYFTNGVLMNAAP